jgi:hypothetical protein
MVWTPMGYQHIREWLDEELRRREQEDKKTEGPGWWRAFDDLGNFLAEEWTQEKRFAVFVFESGRNPCVIPLYEWRKSPQGMRDKIADKRIYRNYNAMGFGSSEPGFVAIKRDLRLDMEPDAPELPTQATELPPITKSTPISGRMLAEFMDELNRQFAGKIAPSLKAIDDAGRDRFREQWRKDFRDQRNATDPKTGDPLYPNLYCTIPGKRRGRRS